ncbi:MAG: ADP-ribosylglycohydrolase family protein, partial [Acidimicrobiales bacterium]
RARRRRHRGGGLTGPSPHLEEIRAQARGCLLGGAIGDALGAPVEFLSIDEIRARVDPQGVRGFLPAYGRAAGAITDDTQMTLFTAEAMIRALVRESHRGICHPPSHAQRSYWRWLTTQGFPWPPVDHVPDPGRDGWLITVEGLHQRRAPGNSCISALQSGKTGTIEEPINHSKGCGALMRSAPIGYASATDPFGLAAECAALTHGHPSGYLAAGFLATMTYRFVMLLDYGGVHDVEDAVDYATRALVRVDGHEEVLAAVRAGRDMAAQGRPSPEDLERLGGGWVAEEALAISICCALSARDLLDGLLLAVNHSGDSDSTGSITGNILGAYLGESALPLQLLEDLELRDVITTVADDLVDAFHGEGVGDEYEPIDARVARWMERYPQT